MSERAAHAVDVRNARSSDAAAMAAVHAALFDPSWRTDQFERLLAETTTAGLIATSRHATTDTEMIGFVLAQAVGDEAEILTIAVCTAHQGRGIGGVLLSASADALTTAGVEWLHLEVAATNLSARALYARAGFRSTGERLKYYSASPDGSAITMVKRLGTPD